MNLPSRTGLTLIVTLCIAVPLLQACVSTPTQESTGEYLDDATTTAKVKMKLLGDPTISGFAISVETFRGRVILSGFVNSQDQLNRAIALAKEVPGVSEVQSALMIKNK